MPIPFPSPISHDATLKMARTLVMKQRLNWLPALYNTMSLLAIDVLDRSLVVSMLENHSDHDSEAETNYAGN